MPTASTYLLILPFRSEPRRSDASGGQQRRSTRHLRDFGDASTLRPLLLSSLPLFRSVLPPLRRQLLRLRRSVPLVAEGEHAPLLSRWTRSMRLRRRRRHQRHYRQKQGEHRHRQKSGGGGDAATANKPPHFRRRRRLWRGYALLSSSFLGD